MNQVTVIGNLCRNIELHKTVNDSFVGNTAIAVRRDRKNEKGEYEADFFDVKLFGSQADFASKYLTKGSKVCISGRVQIRDYVTKDGVKGRAVEILVNAIENLDAKEEEPNQQTQPKQPAKAPAAPAPEQEIVNDDDLPF